MSSQSDQMANYHSWLKERGQAWPVMRPRSSEPTLAASAAEPLDESQNDFAPSTAEIPSPNRANDQAAPGQANLSRYHELREKASGCMACSLWSTRKAPVWGAGALPARVVFLGDYPDASADAEGAPFAGSVGELLAKMRLAMKLKDADCFFMNVVLCHVPQGQTLSTVSTMACREHLIAQIRATKPEVIVCLGRPAFESLLGLGTAFESAVGRWTHHPTLTHIAIMPTYHPRELLVDPALKRPTWEALQLVMKKLELG